MKYFAALVLGCVLSLPAVASNSSALGPYVECQLPDGSQTYTPIERCKLLGGERRF